METLEQQFEKVKEETNTSHVMEFGDLVSELWNTARSETRNLRWKRPL